MNNIEFVDILKIVVVNSCIKGIKQNLIAPAGRVPQQKYITMSAFYNSLSEADKTVVDSIVKRSVEAAVFQFLCVLDGVVSIENENKGELKLYYENENDNEKTLINDLDEEYLHDLFNTVEQ